MIEFLPLVMGPEEEIETVAKLAKGDETAKQKLIERNLRLVINSAWKFTQDEEQLEEYFSIGCIGLINAVNTYDPGKNVKLSSYAAKCIENEIIMEIRRSEKHRRVSYLEAPISHAKDGFLLKDILGGDRDEVCTWACKNIEIKSLRAAIRKLDTREKKVVFMRYYLCMTHREIGKRLKRTRSCISRIDKAVRIKVKDLLE